MIFDEADYLHRDVQASLRTSVEQLSGLNMFIMTANEPKRLINPIHSRFKSVCFDFVISEDLLREATSWICSILEMEKIKAIDAKQVSNLILQTKFDLRQTLNVVQYELI